MAHKTIFLRSSVPLMLLYPLYIEYSATVVLDWAIAYAFSYMEEGGRNLVKTWLPYKNQNKSISIVHLNKTAVGSHLSEL